MTVAQAVALRIKDLCKQQNITPNKLGKLSGVDPSTITSIFYGKSKNPGVATLTKLCNGLDINIFQFFNNRVFEKNNLEC